MANSLSEIMPKIVARGLMAFRQHSMITRVANRDYEDNAAEYGDSITIELPGTNTPSDVVPGPTPPAGTDRTPKKISLDLDKWRKSDPFHLTDKELTQINKSKNFVPVKISEAIEGLAADVNSHIFGKYPRIYKNVGAVGTHPFASNIDIAPDARQALNELKAPKTGRYMILNFTGENNALKLDDFNHVEKAGDFGPKLDGEIGYKFGFLIGSDTDVPTHTNGNASGFLINGASQAVGSDSITVDTGTGSFNVGDIIDIAGDTTQYAVTSFSATSIGITPSLAASPADNAAVDFAVGAASGTYDVSVAAQASAFSFASRPLTDESTLFDDLPRGDTLSETLTDPLTGISLRLELSRQYKRVAWEFDILYGAQLVRNDAAVRMLGPAT